MAVEKMAAAAAAIGTGGATGATGAAGTGAGGGGQKVAAGAKVTKVAVPAAKRGLKRL